MSLSITCPRCGRTSHNAEDVREGYCGFCSDWTSAGVPKPPEATHDPRTYAERRAFEDWWDGQVAEGWERNGRPPEPVNIRSTPRPSIVNTRPGTPDPEETGPGVDRFF